MTSLSVGARRKFVLGYALSTLEHHIVGFCGLATQHFVERCKATTVEMRVERQRCDAMALGLEKERERAGLEDAVKTQRTTLAGLNKCLEAKAQEAAAAETAAEETAAVRVLPGECPPNGQAATAATEAAAAAEVAAEAAAAEEQAADAVAKAEEELHRWVRTMLHCCGFAPCCIVVADALTVACCRGPHAIFNPNPNPNPGVMLSYSHAKHINGF